MTGASPRPAPGQETRSRIRPRWCPGWCSFTLRLFLPFFNEGRNLFAGSKAHLHFAHLPAQARVVSFDREVFNNQAGFKTLTQPNNSKICHKLQQSHSQPSSQGSCIHPRVLENNNKKAKIWERRIKNTLEDGMETPISCCSTIPSPPEHPYDRDDSPRPRMELPPLCHS